MRLQEYLQINGGFHLEFVPKDGTCLWESVLRCLNRPKEYQYMMLQCQVVLTATEHPDFFCELLKDHILGQYGPLRLPLDEYRQKEEAGTLTSTQKQDQFVPGPFSFITCPEYLLKDGTWGDYGALLVISMMWQQKIHGGVCRQLTSAEDPTHTNHEDCQHPPSLL